MTLQDGVTAKEEKVECEECKRLLALNNKAKKEKELRASHAHEHVVIDENTRTGKRAMLGIVKCARCGEDHLNVEVKAFTNPVRCQCNATSEFYCTCPTTGEPILLEIILT